MILLIQNMKWYVEHIGGDNYVLQAGGVHTSIIDDYVYAILRGHPSPTEWKIVSAEAYGPYAYV